MGGLGITLLVLFVIICAIIIFLVLLQNEEGDSLGGLFSGGSNSAFGSRSGNILTKATYTLITLFFVVTFFLAWLNKSPGDSGLQQDARIQQAETATEWWKKDSDVENPAAESMETATPASSDSGEVGATETAETSSKLSENASADSASH